MESVKNHFRNDIQVLRALSVLSVILTHSLMVFENSFNFGRGGFVGVNVFFVISGFIITSLLARELESSGKIILKNFYSKRIVRILPAASLVIIIGILITVIIPIPKSVAESFMFEGLMASLSLVNWVYYLDLEYYPYGFFQHMWSLSVEEQFYLFWPALLIIIVTFFNRKKKIAINGLIVSILLFSIIAHLWDVSNAAAYGYHSTLGHAWELALGALIAINANSIRTIITNGISKLMYAYGFITIFISVAFIEYDTMATPLWSLPAVSGAAAIIIGGLNSSNYEKSKFWNNKSLAWLGDISYGLYLWHWLIFTSFVYLKTISSGDLTRFTLLTWQELALALALSIVVSWISKKYIEDPIRFSNIFKAGRHVEITLLKRFEIPNAFIFGGITLALTITIIIITYLFLVL